MMNTMELKQNKTQFRLPAWFSRHEFPFQSKTVHISGNTIHYIDEGEGQVILFAHPACAWSFIYRDMVKVLSEHYRCVIPDFPGYGFSEAHSSYDFTVKNQSKILEAFIDKLQLSEILFLGHDTGGPSGFYLATIKPTLFKGFVMTDTIIYPTTEYKKLHRFLGILGTWPVKIINQEFNLIVWAMLNNLKANKVDKNIKAHYFRVFNSRKKRERIRQMLLSLRKSTDLMSQIKKGFQTTLKDKPALLIYGENDPVSKLGIPERILNTLHDAELHIIKGEGHFPHEGNGQEMARKIIQWISKNRLNTSRQNEHDNPLNTNSYLQHKK